MVLIVNPSPPNGTYGALSLDNTATINLTIVPFALILAIAIVVDDAIPDRPPRLVPS
jgi:hypothetical protein